MYKPNPSQKLWLGTLTDRYHESLNEETLSYLASRGIDRDVANGAALGLVIDPDPLHEQYRGRLSIPFITPTGVVAMRFRCLEDHGTWTVEEAGIQIARKAKCDDYSHGKYEGPKGEETRLYNVQALHDAEDAVGIAEGELDALVATMCGIPTVGVPGVQNWKAFYYRLFDDFETVYLLGDGDKAGREFTSKLAPNINGAVQRVMPAGEDVSSFVQKHDAQAFLDLVRQ